MSIFAEDQVGGAINDGTQNVEQTVEAFGIFGFVQSIFFVIGVAILVMVVWKVAKGFAKGDFAGVIKVGVGGILAAILCFNLNIPISLVKGLSGLTDRVTGGVEQVVNDNAGTTTPDQPADPAAPPAPAG